MEIEKIELLYDKGHELKVARNNYIQILLNWLGTLKQKALDLTTIDLDFCLKPEDKCAPYFSLTVSNLTLPL